MKRAHSNDDALLDRLQAGAGRDVEADPRLAVVQALVRTASKPPAAAVERRHLAAISEVVVGLGDADPRPGANGRPTAGETLAPRVPRIRPRPLKLAALVVATALALTGVVFASGGLSAPLRVALEEVGLFSDDTGDGSRVSPRLRGGTLSRRGPKSRCARTGDASPSATPAGCAVPRDRKRGPAPSQGRARRSDR
ncbi:MAG: hypothetical protein H0U12_13130, partial [Thermoleophilaceae bacterium]|nr:hypothetical protein [Thermoleophilaceae bacterium]